MAQKFNPTRVATPGRTVGSDGSFSLYPVEQLSGYMMLARTLETWVTSGTKPNFSPTNPWLWELFDMATFEEVSVKEYDMINTDFMTGRHHFNVNEDDFDLKKTYTEFGNAKTHPEIIAYRERQRKGGAE